jgi:hypothetical protein
MLSQRRIFVDPLTGREDAERLFLDAKLNRTRPDQFAVELNRHILIAAYTQVPSLKILDLGRPYLRAKQDVLKIADDFQIAEPLKDHDVEQAVIEDSALEKWKRTTIQPPVSNQDERALINRSVFRFNGETRRHPSGNLRGLNEITQWAEAALHRHARFFNDLGIKADTRQLREMLSVCAWKIDKTRLAMLDNVPATLQIVRGKAQLGRENIHRPHRQQAKSGIRASKAVNHLVDGAIAASRNDSFKSFLNSATGQAFSFTRPRGRADHAIADDGFEADTLPPRPLAARRGI